MRTTTRATRLTAREDEVWAWVTTPEGVNDELRPWIRMTVPRRWAAASIADIPAGTSVGRSWLLFLGVVPFDFDDLVIVEIEPGRFLERSRLLSARVWEHERSVRSDEIGSVVTDRITFEPRAFERWIPGAGRVHESVIAAIFRHRHRRLQKRFGAQ